MHNVSNFDPLNPPKMKQKCKHTGATTDDAGMDVIKEISTSSTKNIA